MAKNLTTPNLRTAILTRTQQLACRSPPSRHMFQKGKRLGRLTTNSRANNRQVIKDCDGTYGRRQDTLYTTQIDRGVPYATYIASPDLASAGYKENFLLFLSLSMRCNISTTSVLTKGERGGNT